MSSPYERAKGGKLTFKGGLGPEKALDKKKKKHKKKKMASENAESQDFSGNPENTSNANNSGGGGGTGGFSIDVTSKKNYEELFPVEAKKFGFADFKPKSAEDALDEREKKKADRYCK